MRLRLFLAVELDDAARDACAAVAARLRAKRWRGRWVPPANYHLTAAFLGAVDEERVAGVIAALREVASRIPRFDVPLEAVGAFPTTARPRVAWAGPKRPTPAFAAASDAARSSLIALGFAFDRTADPHVTIARADGEAALPPVTAPAAIVHATELTLFRSFTEPAGARYETIERFALGSGA
jgi:2'-5' RNA ligase